MRIQVNGESQEIPDGSSLEDLIRKLSLPAARIAIELNRNVARRTEWADTILSEGDRIEIVHFVGGGSAGHRFEVQSLEMLEAKARKGE